MFTAENAQRYQDEELCPFYCPPQLPLLSLRPAADCRNDSKKWSSALGCMTQHKHLHHRVSCILIRRTIYRYAQSCALGFIISAVLLSLMWVWWQIWMSWCFLCARHLWCQASINKLSQSHIRTLCLTWQTGFVENIHRKQAAWTDACVQRSLSLKRELSVSRDQPESIQCRILFHLFKTTCYRIGWQLILLVHSTPCCHFFLAIWKHFVRCWQG